MYVDERVDLVVRPVAADGRHRRRRPRGGSSSGPSRRSAAGCCRAPGRRSAASSLWQVAQTCWHSSWPSADPGRVRGARRDERSYCARGTTSTVASIAACWMPQRSEQRARSCRPAPGTRCGSCGRGSRRSCRRASGTHQLWMTSLAARRRSRGRRRRPGRSSSRPRSRRSGSGTSSRTDGPRRVIVVRVGGARRPARRRCRAA